MNLQLLDPFRKPTPSLVETTLFIHGQTRNTPSPTVDTTTSPVPAVTALAFNRRGFYLAAGYSDGSIVVWSYLSRSILRVWGGEGGAVKGVEWERDSRTLIAHTDTSIVVLPLSTSTPPSHLPFSSLLPSPKSNYGSIQSLTLPGPATPHLALVTTAGHLLAVNTSKRTSTVVYAPTKGVTATACAFDKTGERLYATTNEGTVIVYEGKAAKGGYKKEKTVEIKGGCAITAIIFSHCGENFLLNSADNTIRLFRTSTFRTSTFNGNPLHLYRNVVDVRVCFDACSFSHDDEHVYGVSTFGKEYHLWVWTTDANTFVDKLEGPQVGFVCLASHPKRAAVATGNVDGCIDLWGIPQNWVALAPDFQALPRNIVYMEKEDEFDTVESSGATKIDDEIHENVDVVSVDQITMFESDSEDEKDAFVIMIDADDAVKMHQQESAAEASNAASAKASAKATVP